MQFRRVLFLSNGEHVTIASGAHTGSTVTNVNQDDVYKETDSITNHITSVSSGGTEYESLSVNTAAVTTAINDDTDVVTATLTASPAGTSEDGGAITYTVTLTRAPRSADPHPYTTLFRSNGEHVTIASGAHTGSTVTNVNQDDVYKETDSITNHITRDRKSVVEGKSL